MNWDNEIRYLFKGGEYIAFTGETPDDYYPRPLTEWTKFPAAWSSGIDAAVNWGNGRIYFFKGGQYVRYDVVPGGKPYGSAPQQIAGNWRGFPPSWSSGINAAINWGDGKIFFFKGREYLRFDITTQQTDPGFPRPIAGNWSGFPISWSSGLDAAANWGNGRIYFFKGDQYVRYDVGPGTRFSYGGARSVAGNWTVFAESARADLNETFVTLPVTVRGFNQENRTGPMILTWYRPDGPGPFPAVVYSHGRSPYHRAWPARRREVKEAMPWLQRGFAFFIATRLGYGGTGLDPDIEQAGGVCAKAQYESGANAVVTQAIAAVNYARNLPFIDPNRIILAGNSTGGLATIAATGMQLPHGVVGAVNYAGGAGGGVLDTGHPCNEPEVRRIIREAGKRARISMLWLYARDDPFWGSDLPKRWHAEYVQSGGTADFRMFDRGGHDIVSYAEVWGAALNEYLAGLNISSRPTSP